MSSPASPSASSPAPGERPRRRARRSRPAGPVTLDDVAKEAGVSLATASRVLNGSTRVVGEALRERVHAAAARLDYSANAQAQAMARGRSDVVGLVVHDIADPYFSSLAAGVMNAAEGSGAIVTLAVSRGDADREVAHVAALRRQRVRAVILAGSRWDDAGRTDALRAELEAFRGSGGLVAAATQDVLGVDTVLVDNTGAAARLAGAVADLGYREALLLEGPEDLLTARDRTAGFLAGLRDRGLGPVQRLSGPFTRDGAYDSVARFLRRGPLTRVDGRPPVLLAANDVMAVGAIAAARDAGLDVPGDLAIAGFDDIPTLRDVSPALTTVRLPLTEIGTRLFELVDTADGGPVRHEHVEGEVLLRASTPPLTA
ncbi:LacI family DNA-binding transcriptional regulator [Kineococcus sp. SYSU DK002]|uniref:LacI family DNA-binding transcriptional regulator n=1 Tax=Kineococcus sp. SYSU DK002 TaxID=3383123 RepID=UPI003D7E3631